MSMAANGQEIDKRLLYGNYQKTADAHAELALKVARKALDIGEDMDIQANQTHNHYHPPAVNSLGKLAIGAALAMGAGGLGLGAWALLRDPAETVIEKVIPGTDTETIVTPGEFIVE